MNEFGLHSAFEFRCLAEEGALEDADAQSQTVAVSKVLVVLREFQHEAGKESDECNEIRIAFDKWMVDVRL